MRDQLFGVIKENEIYSTREREREKELMCIYERDKERLDMWDRNTDTVPQSW